MSGAQADPGAYDIRSALMTITLLCEPNGEPCDGFRFRELILKARGFLAAIPANTSVGGVPVAIGYLSAAGKNQLKSSPWVKLYRDANFPANIPVYDVAPPADASVCVPVADAVREEIELIKDGAKNFNACWWGTIGACDRALTLLAAQPANTQADTRKAILEEAALVCRARITGTRRTADHEAAECMNAIRAMYLPPEQSNEIEDWS